MTNPNSTKLADLVEKTRNGCHVLCYEQAPLPDLPACETGKLDWRSMLRSLFAKWATAGAEIRGLSFVFTDAPYHLSRFVFDAVITWDGEEFRRMETSELSESFRAALSTFEETVQRAIMCKSLNLKFYVALQCLASLRVRRRILARSAQAVELSIVRSQSLANRRHLPSHAKVRSTTHRLGSRTKPFALSGRLTVSSVHSSPMACRSLSPAYPPSVKIWRKHGNFLPAALSRSGAPSRSWMLAA